MGARIPSVNKRLYALDIVEKNCRTKGKFLQKDVVNFSTFINKVKSMYPAYKDTITKCLESTKNILMEFVKWVHSQCNATNIMELNWFKALLNLVIKCVRAGLRYALSFLSNFVKWSTENLLNTAVGSGITLISVTAITSSIVLGLVASTIILGMGLWFNSLEAKTIELRSKPSLLDWIKEKIHSLTSDDEIPEELKPPTFEAPVLTTEFRESASASVVGAILFGLFLKAVIIARFNEETKEKISILSSLLTPTSALLGLLSTLLLLGSGGASAIVA